MKSSVLAIIDKFEKLYENPKCELVFHSDYELLVAVILSAQCTDKRVNIVTKELFKNYNTPEKMITLSQEELENKIRACGFFHNKAKHILSASKELIEKYNGKIPNDKNKLKKLAGVGEKTANVVMATAFNVPAIAVDTHVFRVSNRLGLAYGKNVTKVQKDLGRYVCKSQRPLCEICEAKEVCKFYKNKK